MTLNSRFSHTTSEGSGAGPTLRACRFLQTASHSQEMLQMARGGLQGRAGRDRAEQDLTGQGTFRRARPSPEEQDRTIAQEESGQEDGRSYRKKQGCQS